MSRQTTLHLLATTCAAIVMTVSTGAMAQTRPVRQGLVLWLKADAGLAADGSTWTDQSGRAHGATAIAGQAPAYVAAGLNGLPVARFQGGQAMDIAGQLLDSQDFTIVAVASDRSEPGASGYREIISNWSVPTSSDSIFLGTVWNAVDGKLVDRIRFTDAIGGLFQGQTGQGRIPKPSRAFILSAGSAPSEACTFLATKDEYCLGSGLPVRDLSQPWAIGRQGQSFSSEFWVGDIAEILVYDRTLSAAQWRADLAYLAAKWGIATR